MLVSTRNLPADYTQTDEIDLSKNMRLAIILNIFAALLFFVSIWLLSAYISQVRPEFDSHHFTFEVNPSTLSQILAAFLVIAANLIIHEAIHGVFFWWFTRSRPVFALKFTYAYAAAPEWYIPGKAYILIGLAPLLIIDLVALILISFVPAWAIFPLLLALTFNTSGAVGDLWIVAHLLRTFPAPCLVNDRGDSVRFYTPVSSKPGTGQA